MSDMSREELRDYAATIRSMIAGENALVNSRMGWLLTLQGLLFAALSFVWNLHSALSVSVAIVGLAVSFSLGFYLRCNMRSIDWPPVGTTSPNKTIMSVHG